MKKICLIIFALSSWLSAKENRFITIGTFDGFHLGHQFMIQKMIADAKKADAIVAVVLIPPDFLRVLFPELPVSHILDAFQIIDLLFDEGVDEIYQHHFNIQTSRTSYSTFIDKIQQEAPFSTLYISTTSTIGKDREGTPEELTSYGHQTGFHVEIVPVLEIEQQAVTHRNIVNLLQTGQFSQAEKLLNRPYRLRCMRKEDGQYYLLNLPLLPAGTYQVQLPTGKNTQIEIEAFQTENPLSALKFLDYTPSSHYLTLRFLSSSSQ